MILVSKMNKIIFLIITLFIILKYKAAQEILTVTAVKISLVILKMHPASTNGTQKTLTLWKGAI